MEGTSFVHPLVFHLMSKLEMHMITDSLKQINYFTVWICLIMSAVKAFNVTMTSMPQLITLGVSTAVTVSSIDQCCLYMYSFMRGIADVYI